MTASTDFTILTPSQVIIANQVGLAVERIEDAGLGIVVRTVNPIRWIEEAGSITISEYVKVNGQEAIVEYKIPTA